MDEGLLDISKIPRFQFQLHNEQLANCIKQLHFHLKTQQKRVEKCRKDIDIRISENTLADLFTQLTAAIDLPPQLIKTLPSRGETTHDEGAMRNGCSKLGTRLGQLTELLRLLWEKVAVVERRQEQAESTAKQQVSQRVQTVQGQLDQLKKAQARENRTQSEALMLAQNKFEEKLKEVQSKTLWQINDCKVKLNDRVNEQFVKDQVKEAETKLLNKVKQASAKNAIDPQTIDNLQVRCIRIEKDMEVKAVEMTARVTELRDFVNNNLATKKDMGLEKLQGQRRNNSTQIAIAEASLKLKTVEQGTKEAVEDIKELANKQDSIATEVSKLTKLVSNLKMSDDFMRLMEKLDPHKICEMDTSIATLQERQLKDEKEVQALKRYFEKFKEKVELGNVVSGEQPRGLERDDVGRILQELLLTHPALKKVSALQGQLFELKAYGDSISQLSKRMGKIQKEFDLQPVIYGLRGLEEYMKKELLMVNTKVGQLESQLAEDRRSRRPLSAKKISSDSRITSSVSFKKLLPVDCISCFQNPLGERTPPERFKR